MRGIMLVALLAACGGNDLSPVQRGFYGKDGEPTGPIQEACAVLAESMCTGYDADEKPDPAVGDTQFLSCVRNAYRSACKEFGTASCTNGGCCVRSSVDFTSCTIAVDALGDPIRGCGDSLTPTPDCTPVPDECKSAACATAGDGCAEDPGKVD